MGTYEYQKQLFNNWQELGHKVSMSGNIIQNQIDLTESDVEEWISVLSHVLSEMTDLASRTLEFVMNNMVK